MKAILEFDLNEPGERTEHQRMLKYNDLHIVIYEMLQELRRWYKHTPQSGDEKVDQIKADFAEELADTFYAMLDDRGLDID